MRKLLVVAAIPFAAPALACGSGSKSGTTSSTGDAAKPAATQAVATVAAGQPLTVKQSTWAATPSPRSPRRRSSTARRTQRFSTPAKGRGGGTSTGRAAVRGPQREAVAAGGCATLLWLAGTTRAVRAIASIG